MMESISISERTGRARADKTKPEFVMNAVPVSKTRQLTSRFALLALWLLLFVVWLPASAQAGDTKVYVVDTSLNYAGFPGNSNPFPTHRTNEFSGSILVHLFHTGGGGGRNVQWSTEPAGDFGRGQDLTMADWRKIMQTDSEYATAGEDYMASGGQLNFPSGAGIATALIPIIDESVDEFNEDILFHVTNPQPRAFDAMPRQTLMLCTSNSANALVFERGLELPLVPQGGGLPDEACTTVTGDNAADPGAREHMITAATILFDDTPAGAVDSTFVNDSNDSHNDDDLFIIRPGANNQVLAVAVDAAQRTIIGGEFTGYNGTTRNRIARILNNGRLDASFNPQPASGANGEVSAIEIQSDGRILIGGDFSSYNGVNRNGIARLNTDGSLDTSFNPGTGVDGQVRVIKVDSQGRVVIGGDFLVYNGNSANRIVRVNANGDIDGTFNPGTGANGAVYALGIASGDRIVMGGQFTMIDGIGRNRIAKLNVDGSVDVSFDPGSGVNNTVFDLVAEASGKVMIVGDFTMVGTESRNRISRLSADGTLDPSFHPGRGAEGGADNTIYSVLRTSGGLYYIAGLFESYNHNRRQNMARLLSNGATDVTFMDHAYNQKQGPDFRIPGGTSTMSYDSFIRDMALQTDGNILIGGSFDSVGGTDVNMPLYPNGPNDISINPLGPDMRPPLGIGQNNPTDFNDTNARENFARIKGDSTPGPGYVTFPITEFGIDERAASTGIPTLIPIDRVGGDLGQASVEFYITDVTANQFVDFNIANANNIIFWPHRAPPTGPVDLDNASRNASTDRQYIGVLVSPDTIIEDTEEFQITLDNPTSSIVSLVGNNTIPTDFALAFDSQMTVKIIDDDFDFGDLTFTDFTLTSANPMPTAGTPGSYVHLEHETAVVTVTRTGKLGDPTGDVTVQYQTGDGGLGAFLVPDAVAGVDYQSVSGTLTFLAGETTKTITIPLIDDLSGPNPSLPRERRRMGAAPSRSP